jgi:ABC-type antimicrobial peptide transport system permease subunit
MMRLALQSLRFYALSHLVVVFGVAVGAAVLTGALIVGDSLKQSLYDKAERQLHGAKGAYAGARLVREDIFSDFGDTMPLLLLRGSVRHTPKDGDEKRLGQVNIYGVRDADREKLGLPPGVVLSANAAAKLQAAPGSRIDLGLEKMSKIPRSSLLGKKDLEDATARTRAVVDAVLPADHAMNDFNLSPSPLPPVNVFVPLPRLQKDLEIPGKANVILSFAKSAGSLNALWRSKLDLADWQLVVKAAPTRPDDSPKPAYTVVESEQLILDDTTVAAVERACAKIGARPERTFTYLANAITPGAKRIKNRDPGNSKTIIPYSVIAALNNDAPAPLGPFFPNLKDGEIALLDWPGNPLNGLKPGDLVTVAFFVPEMETTTEENEEAWETFRFAGYIPFTGPARDRDLTPPFPGITDKPKIRGKRGEQWEAPFQINYARIQQRDDEFWEQHGPTPKAYITRTQGERLFASRFGTTTSIRVAPPAGLTPEQTAEALKAELLKELDPASAGFQVEDLQARLKDASQGGTDFGAMLLAFSGALIVSALLLVAMFFRLGLDRRAKEIGLLLATGYSPRQVNKLLTIESSIVALAGGVVGTLMGIAYAQAMLNALGWFWPDAQIQTTLRLHVKPFSLLIGFELTMVIAWLATHFAIRSLWTIPVPSLLRGETAKAEGLRPSGKNGRTQSLRIQKIAIVVCLFLGLALVVSGRWAANPDMRAGAFFGGGFLLMAGGLLAFRAWLKREHGRAVVSDLTALGWRNATRSTGRSLFTVALLAFATFLLVAVESFRKKPDAEFEKETGGSGGYRLMMETEVPVFRAAERKEFQGDLLTELSRDYQEAEARGGKPRQERLNQAEDDLANAKILPFRLRSGDDASCLNLYQAGKPRVLGVPGELLGSPRFAFAMTDAKTPEEKANPWRLLERTFPDGAVPCIAEQNTVLWQLKTFVGGTVAMPDETGREVKFRIVATLQDSPFQSELLIGEANFRKLYPHEEGFRVFLVQTPADRAGRVAALLETGLRGNGASVEPTAGKVALFQQVIGAYLSTFQLLGGLGLLLGVLGYGAVILRNIFERTGELALLRCVGYRSLHLYRTLLAENLLLLAAGLGLGFAAAAISVLPNAALGGQPFSARLGAMLAAVAGTGLLVALAASRRVLAVPLIPALRKE